MITLHYPEIPLEKNLVAATGFFDGVHCGHQMILHNIVETAKRQGRKSCLVTFWPHPRIVLGKDAESLRMLTSIDEKLEIVSKLGIDYFYLIPFTHDFSKLSGEEFFKNILVDTIGISQLFIGYNHHLGCDAQANFNDIEKIGSKYDISVCKIDAVVAENIKISSTNIRLLLENGDIVTANKMLGYKYKIKGNVVHGNEIGRSMGFPTANIQPQAYKLIPKNGVYAVNVNVKNVEYKGMLNIGLRPTLNNAEKPIVEVNIFDFDEDIYDLTISVSLVERVRCEKKFDTLEELKQQLKKDERKIRKIEY